MSTDRDLDRTTRAWLDLMPDEVSDRVIADVLQAVEAAPQVRGPRVAGPMRSIHMNRFFPVAVAAVLGVGLLGAVLLAGGRGNTNPVPSSSPPAVAVASAPVPSAPVASPSEPPPVVGIPDELKATWFGSHRDLGGIEPGSGTVLRFGPTGLAITPPNAQSQTLLSVKATIDGARLLVSGGDTRTCPGDQAGTYDWSISPFEGILTISLETDPCAARAATLPGTWWRAGCKIGTTCLGSLEAGTYASQYLTLHASAGSSWTPPYGSLTYTVPDGWANSADWPSIFTLTPATSYLAEDASGNTVDGTRHEVRVLAAPAAAMFDSACEPIVDAKASSAADMMSSIVAHPWVSATNVGVVDVGGSQAQVADLRLAPGDKAKCRGQAMKSMPLLIPRADDAYRVELVAGERLRIVLVPMSGGDVAAIVIDSNEGAAAFQALVDAAMPVVQSMHFQ